MSRFRSRQKIDLDSRRPLLQRTPSPLSSSPSPDRPAVLQQEPELPGESGSEEEEREEEEESQQEKRLFRPSFMQEDQLKRQRRLRQQIKEQFRVKEKGRSKRLEAKLLLLEAEELEQEQTQEEEQNIELPDDDDFKDEKFQYQLWKVRQLERIKRDRLQTSQFQTLKSQTQRRSRLTDEQRLIQNSVLQKRPLQKTKYVFMQKYYHKGAFFQDQQDSVLTRNYNLPTPMEVRDVSALPKILQKRRGNLWKKGQSKYTHLTAEDTSQGGQRVSEDISRHFRRQQGGFRLQ